MKNNFVSYEQALSVKELGFDEPCFGYFNGKQVYRLGGDATSFIDKISTYRNTYLSLKDNFIAIPNEGDWENNPNTVRRMRGIMVAAPLKQQLFKWFRDKHKLHSRIQHQNGFYWYEIESYFGQFVKKYNTSSDLIKKYDTYEEAESDCIDKLIEIVKNKID